MIDLKNIEKYINQKDARSIIVWGNFSAYKDALLQSFLSQGFDVTKPGHYLLNSKTFDIDEARNLLEFYESKVKSNDSCNCIIIAPDVFKNNASELLLKFIEELDDNYKLFICLPYGTFVLPTILSRVQQVYINTNKYPETYIQEFLSKSEEERLGTVAKITKNMEAFEIREYTQKLLSDCIVHINLEEKKRYLVLNNLLTMQKNVIQGTIAPKFVLDFVCVSL
jgi:hypothetical protein